MSLLSEMGVVTDLGSVAFNTGTLFDLATGRYELGFDGEWYLNGGLSTHINMLVGMSSQYKSTLANSLCIRCVGIYKDTDYIIKDSEDAINKDKNRAMRMAEEYYTDDLKKRMMWLDAEHYNLDNTDEYIRKYCLLRQRDKKELTVETPFLDQMTGKRLKVWKPTFLNVDSLSMLRAEVEEELLDSEKSKGIGDSKINTLHMADGNKKTIFTLAMRRRCQQHGIVFMVTGHYDSQIQMDPYAVVPKDTLFSKGNFKVKGCGSEIKFLATIYARCQATLLQDSGKLALYGEDNTQPKDVHEVSLLLERCKTSNAGEATPFVVSQTEGLLNTVTNYHYLRLHNYFGLNGNKQKQQVALYPDLTISRNTIRELAKSTPQLRRALELTAQLCFIKNNWTIKTIPYDLNVEPKALFDKLMSDKNKTLVDDILNSRGYWTYLKDDRHYMSLFKILELAKLNL